LEPQTIKHNNTPPPPQQKQEKKAVQTNSRHQTKPRKILSFSQLNTSAAKLEEDYRCEREIKEHSGVCTKNCEGLVI
jgi:hypothetical protein